MTLPPNPWVLLAAGLALVAALGGAYVQGRSDGRAVVNAEVARAMQKATVELERRRDVIGQIAGDLAAAQSRQTSETREIYHESLKIIDRPVYHNVCVDADGVGLLDRAATNAGAALGSEPARPAH